MTVADVRRLPVPVTTIWDWQMRAACRNLDSSMFFHPENERGPAKADRDRRAKVICGACPVIESCRRHALAVREPYGVWGGLTVTERDAVLRGQERHPARVTTADSQPFRTIRRRPRSTTTTAKRCVPRDQLSEQCSTPPVVPAPAARNFL